MQQTTEATLLRLWACCNYERLALFNARGDMCIDTI